jgi:TRAP-type C4-dicarboxylate transport system permease small subunit
MWVIRQADNWLARLESVILGLLVLAMTGVTLAQVIWRYVLNEPLIWSEEAARYLFVWLSLIGASLAVKEGAHYLLDAMAEKLPAKLRLVVSAIVFVITVGFLVILLKTGINETRQASLQDAATLPIHMSLAYLAIPVGAALMLFHTIAGLFQPKPPKEPFPEATE